MSHNLFNHLLANIALSAQPSKALYRLIINYYPSQFTAKSIPITIMAPQKFLAQQGLYVSSLICQIVHSSSEITVNDVLQSPDFSWMNSQSEQIFDYINSPQSNHQSLLNNSLEWGGTPAAQLAVSNLETDLTNWIVWVDSRGYLYFQPTAQLLKIWLKMLFDRAFLADQNVVFSAVSDSTAAHANFLQYIELRCVQVQKLVKLRLDPWQGEGLNCTQVAELELIYGIMLVYDSLYMGAKYKILAAGKSLGEKFLEFDRTCRLLDLDPNSPEFHERAGLVVLSRSAIRDLWLIGRQLNH
jgi:hypothetical protein